MTDYDVAIAGAGIVGMSTALWAQRRGHKTLLVDHNPPGSGASFGNAGTLATYACLPVNDPSVLTSLPALLFGKNSPLAISFRHALKNPRWMLSFLANCSAKRSHEISGELARLLSHADAGINPLIDEAGAEDLVVSSGQLSIWSSKSGADSAARGLALRRSHGVLFEELTTEDARTLEPNVALPVARAVFYPTARHITDPQELVRRMHKRFEELGGQTLAQEVQRATPEADRVVIETGAETIQAGKLVVASGAFSGRISGVGTDSLPLGAERGYHLMFASEAHRISRPVGWAEGGFYAVPMAQGLRIAGTVEIDATDKPANTKRFAYLKRRAEEMFGNLPQPDSHWLGFRPTMPDSLPVIGTSPGSKNVIHAFGHQHLGLTLGGITGRIAVDLVEGRQPNLDISGFRSDRRFLRF